MARLVNSWAKSLRVSLFGGSIEEDMRGDEF
jgi:hypothetical protein